MKLTFTSVLFFVFPILISAQKVFIPAAGNAWTFPYTPGRDQVVTREGIKNWADTATIIRIWFRTESAGDLEVSLYVKVEGKTEILMKCENQSKPVTLQNVTNDTIQAGKFHITKPGYHFIEFRGLNRTGNYFVEMPGIIIEGEATSGKLTFVRDDFHFGRRGPSVHLRYDLPAEASEIMWFYNEITVPEGEDVPGSYFMANGFADGYFGMQVNSGTERRILFSVWSPYKTDNPGEIPEEYRITLLKKGSDVVTGEFGNEGSGGQSFRRYNWKSGNTYRFLLRGAPSVKGSTDYTAWFYAPETGKWDLIASFRRPKTDNYLKNLYSFLENFIPETGSIARKGYYSNQWVADKAGKWYELTSARFTADATARKGARLDYAGGTENGKFFLKNCGFFDNTTQMDQAFKRNPSGNQPVIKLTNTDFIIQP
ncbi:MAG TPA: DUF3472 domain-containing protein [Bacteroidales bacterium]|nr:DUF3472 domain-containing protein [Bacteroidales bacterium]